MGSRIKFQIGDNKIGLQSRFKVVVVLKFYKNRTPLLILISEQYFFLGHTLIYLVRSRMKSGREKMHESAIETARYGVGISVRPGPPIETDGDCLISAAISQVIWPVWKFCIKHVELEPNIKLFLSPVQQRVWTLFANVFCRAEEIDLQHSPSKSPGKSKLSWNRCRMGKNLGRTFSARNI